MQLIGITLVNTLVVALVVLIHYECLYRLTRRMPIMRGKYQYRIVIGVAGALLAHVVEIWVFALAYYIMVTYLGWGTFGGSFQGTLLDCAYFSFTTFSTLGFGDIMPIGPVRYLTGIESLTGLVLITWSASFLYLEMQNYWSRD